MIDLAPIFTAVRQAAALTRRVQQTHLTKTDKPGREPVTIADYGSQAVLLRAIQAAFPDDSVLAEESAGQFESLLTDAQRAEIVTLVRAVTDDGAVDEDAIRGWLDHGRGGQAERQWVVDPIDGTKGFLAMRRYSIAVGLVDRGQPVAGVLGSPGYPTADGSGWLFYAQGGKAYCQSLNGGGAERIAVSTRTQPRQFRAVQSVEKDHGHLERMARIYSALGIPDAQIEGIDSQDKYAMLAFGDAELYLRLPREEQPQHRAWDHAAGVAIVRAAGGVVTDLDGSALDFSTGAILSNNRGMVVSNGLAHDAVLEAVAAALTT